MDEFTLDPHLLYSDWILTETEFEPKQNPNNLTTKKLFLLSVTVTGQTHLNCS